MRAAFTVILRCRRQRRWRQWRLEGCNNFLHWWKRHCWSHVNVHRRRRSSNEWHITRVGWSAPLSCWRHIVGTAKWGGSVAGGWRSEVHNILHWHTGQVSGILHIASLRTSGCQSRLELSSGNDPIVVSVKYTEQVSRTLHLHHRSSNHVNTGARHHASAGNAYACQASNTAGNNWHWHSNASCFCRSSRGNLSTCVVCR
mmetsp:Transcript_65349/g.156230  ORF Transcript_65349/g.156230 Transcript_65349/m.156230 type:complete len:200 (+) Transcript_65349:1166-1765(+)